MKSSTRDEVVQRILQNTLNKLDMTLEDLPCLPEPELVESVATEIVDTQCAVEPETNNDVSIPLEFPQPQIAALTWSVPSTSCHERDKSALGEPLEVLMIPDRGCLAAASAEESVMRTARGQVDGATYSLSAIGHDGSCTLRVAGPEVSAGCQPVVEIGGSDRTALRFDRFGFGLPPSESVNRLVWDALIDQRHRDTLHLKFPQTGTPGIAQRRSVVWVKLADVIRDAELGKEAFLSEMDRIASASSDLSGLGKWCDVLRTEVIEQWLFRPGGFPRAAGRSGFGALLLGQILAIVFRRRVLSLRTTGDIKQLSRFWNHVCNLLIMNQDTALNRNETVRRLFALDTMDDLVTKSSEIEDVADDEAAFSANVESISRRLAETEDVRFRWALYCLQEISAERKREAEGRPAARIVAVWVPGVLSRTVSEIIRPGVLLDFDFAPQAERRRKIGPEFSPEFCGVLNAQDKHWGGVGLVPRENELRKQLGKGCLEGRSGSLAVQTSISLLNLDQRRGSARGVLPFVVISADKRGSHVEEVSGLAEKISVLSEEGVRLFVVADSQRERAQELAPQG